jgi:hypothetical protein
MNPRSSHELPLCNKVCAAKINVAAALSFPRGPGLSQSLGPRHHLCWESPILSATWSALEFILKIEPVLAEWLKWERA